MSVLTFLHYFAFGSIIPIFSLYLLKNLAFSGSQVGTILAAGAVSAVITPFVSSFIADKVISSERLFSLAHLCGSLTMIFLYFNDQFLPVFLGYLVYKAFSGPTLPLADAIIFHHIPDREKYGSIRVFGTIGWISAALFFGFLVLRQTGNLSHGFLVSACVSMIVGLFSLTIPATKLEKGKNTKLFPAASFKILSKPQVLVLIVTTVMIFFADRFYFYGSSPYLKDVGFSENFIMPYLSIGQVSEIFAMLSLGYFMKRFRARFVMIAGILANVLRYSIFTMFPTKIGALSAIAFHGVAYAFFFSAVFIYLDYQVDKNSRAGVHQIFRIIYLGFGTLFGNLTAGYIKDNYEWRHFWLTPAIISVIVLLILVFIPDRKQHSKKRMAQP